MRSLLKYIRLTLNYSILIFATLTLYSHSKLKKLPQASDVLASTFEEPLQSEIQLPAFTFSYENNKYQLIPQAQYRINGLVISHNNVAGIGDAYHTSKSVDLKDLCLLWGENAVSPYLDKMKFWSEPWTCFFQTDDQEAYASFNLNQISNNHLLAANSNVKKIIQDIRIGDQVEIEGLLVDYYPHGAAEALRKTSLTRDDTGNGACEVLYVKNIRITKKWLPGYSRLYYNSKSLLYFLLALKIITFLSFPWLEYKFS